VPPSAAKHAHAVRSLVADLVDHKDKFGALALALAANGCPAGDRSALAAFLAEQGGDAEVDCEAWERELAAAVRAFAAAGGDAEAAREVASLASQRRAAAVGGFDLGKWLAVDVGAPHSLVAKLTAAAAETEDKAAAALAATPGAPSEQPLPAPFCNAEAAEAAVAAVPSAAAAPAPPPLPPPPRRFAASRPSAAAPQSAPPTPPAAPQSAASASTARRRFRRRRAPLGGPACGAAAGRGYEPQQYRHERA